MGCDAFYKSWEGKGVEGGGFLAQRGEYLPCLFKLVLFDQIVKNGIWNLGLNLDFKMALNYVCY